MVAVGEVVFVDVSGRMNLADAVMGVVTATDQGENGTLSVRVAGTTVGEVFHWWELTERHVYDGEVV